MHRGNAYPQVSISSGHDRRTIGCRGQFSLSLRQIDRSMPVCSLPRKGNGIILLTSLPYLYNVLIALRSRTPFSACSVNALKSVSAVE